MKRLLCIVGSMDAGGAETFLMKVYRSIDKSKYQMDFCVAKKEKNFYEDEITSMGGKIYRITPKSRNPFKNFFDIKKIVKDNNYTSVLRVSQHTLSSLELLAAKLGGGKKLVFRSSNSNTGGGKLNLLIHYLFRPIANCISNIKIAPSKEAGDFMFGKRQYTIINNGLDLDTFKFSKDKRKRIRSELGIDDSTIVIGHVGRFNFQKNHKFLLEIFDKYHKKNKNSELWLFGKGELENEIKSQVNSFGLGSSVRFMGVKENVSDYYSAMDCYIFPSLFEGMPNTVIEAEVSGLPCVISDTITKDCKFIDELNFLSLNDVEAWVDSIHAAKKRNVDLANIDFDIKKTVEDFIKLF